MMPPREGPPMERRESRLSRRQFVAGTGVAGLGLLAGCGRLPWQAQAPARVPRIGYLIASRLGPNEEEAFHQALGELGYAERETVIIEWRSAEGRPERLPELARELAQLPVDILVAPGTVA